MPDYRKMYQKLFNAITDTILLLQKAQKECEEIYCNEETKPLIQLPRELHKRAGYNNTFKEDD